MLILSVEFYKGSVDMQKKISSIPFKGTPEQETELKKFIEENKHDKSRLMAVMQAAQEIYGYLPMEVQMMIADGMDVPLEKVFGVATFYAQFALSPKGEYNISVCLGTACYVKGAQAVLDKISEILGIGVDECTPDGKFSLQACRCIGACGLGPVMMINDEVFGKLTPDAIPGILAKFNA
jgi:NADP-reducing hydrogenase subunit HndA